MRIRVCVLLTAFALAVAAASARAASSTPPGCPALKAHTGNTSGDWEAVFGRRPASSSARSLLRHVRAKGFRCAVIENEQGTHEVAVIAISRRAAAAKLVRRAHRLHLRATVASS
jgi:hypothetical protein